MSGTHAAQVTGKAPGGADGERISFAEAEALAREGDGYYFLGLFEEALGYYARVPREHEEPYIHCVVGRINAATTLDWREEALQAAEEGLASGIDDYRLREKCAIAFQTYGDPERAVHEYNKLFGERKFSARLVFCLGYAQADAGNYSTTLSAFSYSLEHLDQVTLLAPLAWDYELHGFWQYVRELEINEESACKLCSAGWMKVKLAGDVVREIEIDRRTIRGCQEAGVPLPPLDYNPQTGRFGVRAGLKGSDARLAEEFKAWLAAARASNIAAATDAMKRARDWLAARQLGYARRRCVAGDHNAAMLHTICGLASRPEDIGDYLACPELEPIGDFLGQLKQAVAVNPRFCALMQLCRDQGVLKSRMGRQIFAAGVPSDIGHLWVVRRMAGFVAEYDEDYEQALEIYRDLHAEGCNWAGVAFAYANLLGVHGRHGEALGVLAGAHPSWRWFNGAEALLTGLLAKADMSNAHPRCADFAGQEDTCGISRPLDDPPPPVETLAHQCARRAAAQQSGEATTTK